MAGEISWERGNVSCNTNTPHFGSYMECSLSGSHLGLEDLRRLLMFFFSKLFHPGRGRWGGDGKFWRGESSWWSKTRGIYWTLLVFSNLWDALLIIQLLFSLKNPSLSCIQLTVLVSGGCEVRLQSQESLSSAISHIFNCFVPFRTLLYPSILILGSSTLFNCMRG